MVDHLLGREAERGRLADLRDEVRAGSSRAVVLRGAAGIGKTALLDDLAANAAGFRVVRAAGAEFESDLPFAGLTTLIRPLLAHLEDLPPAHAAALATACGEAGEPVDRFTVYAATLSLLSAAAEDAPLLCLVDDAHWLDRASAEAMLFAARRLLAESVLLVFATRDLPTFDAPGIADVVLGGLDRESGATLLRRGGVSGVVVERLLDVTDGNPLALVEIPRALTAEQRAGHTPLGESLPRTDRLERAFTSQVATLGADERRAVLTCAVAGTASIDLILGALDRLGIPPSTVDNLVRTGLLRQSGPDVTFRHPLVRSAVHSLAGPGERREVHQALAEACTAPVDADRAAWHRAHAATGPDAAVADALAATAERASRRGGMAAEAAAWERAAFLSTDPIIAGRRLNAAAVVWMRAGAVEHAEATLRRAAPLLADAPERMVLLGHRAYLAMLRGEVDAMFDELVAAADRGAARDPRSAGMMLSMAMNGPAARWDVPAILGVCERAMALATPGGPDEVNPKMAVRLAYAQVLAGDPDGVRLARECVPFCLRARPMGARSELAEVMFWIEEYGDARRLLDLDVDAARGNGDISLLVYALPLRAQLEIRLGRLAAAYADALEGVELAETMGQPFNTAEALVVLAHVEALSGRCEDCAVHAKQAMELAPHNLAVESRARHALGLEALVAGRTAAAVDELARADAILCAGGVVEPAAVPVAGDLAEALALAGRGAEAAEVVGRLEEGVARTARVGQAAVAARVGQAAVAARVRALLADDAAPFETGLALAGAAPLDEARTRLRYGQWLRRARKRQRARVQLEAALEAFEALGAKPWADRAREELSPNAAAGPDDAAGLTPHEWRIAYAAAQGSTSPEIAARMLLSVRTVDYHLGNVYRKLGIRSRRELAGRLD